MKLYVTDEYEIDESRLIKSDRIDGGIIPHLILQTTALHLFIIFSILSFYILKYNNIITYSWLLYLFTQIIKCTMFEFKTIFYDYISYNSKIFAVSYAEGLTIGVFANILLFHFFINYFYFYKKSQTILNRLKYITPILFFVILSMAVLSATFTKYQYFVILGYILFPPIMDLISYHKIGNIVKTKINDKNFDKFYIIGYIGKIILIFTYIVLPIINTILRLINGTKNMINFWYFTGTYLAAISYIFNTFAIIVTSKLFNIYKKENNHNYHSVTITTNPETELTED